MKKIKKYIVVLGIIVVLLVMVLLGIQWKQTKQQEIEQNNGNQEESSIARTTNMDKFYTVDKCIQTYLMEIELKDAEIALSLLNDEYIKENRMTEENVWNYVPEYNHKESYRTKEMYEIGEESYTTYWVKGRMDQKDIFFEVAMDATNKTFAITPIAQKRYEERQENIQKKQIDKKVYNVIVYQKMEEGMIAKACYDDFLKAMIYDEKEAYQMLDPTYREKRFKDEKGFKEFVEKNKEFFTLTYQVETLDSSNYENYDDYYSFQEEHKDLGAKNYLKEEYEEYTRYVCADIYENYYIFHVTMPGEYRVIYDNHTIDLPEFTKKYNGSNKQIRMGMNIEKFFDAINTNDFTYAYEVLAESFKGNYYATQEDFENEIKQNLFEHNNVEYHQYTEEGDTLVYEITVKDRTNEENTKDMTIVMQLQEGTDFIMSFSIE